MSYVEKVLHRGESVVYRGGLHWVIYRQSIFATTLAAVSVYLTRHATARAAAFFGDAAPLVMPSLELVALLCIVYAIFTATAAFLRASTTEIAVTNRRLICKTGILGRHTIEIGIDKIGSVDVDQTLFGRLFGYGCVTVRATGLSMDEMDWVRDPIELRSAVFGDD